VMTGVSMSAASQPIGCFLITVTSICFSPFYAIRS
jgi:hypothetical protein